MEKSKFEAYKKKLDGITDENNLVYRLRLDEYPVSLTVQPMSGVSEQMELFESEKPASSPDAKLVFKMEDGELCYQMSDRLVISDALFGKIKNLFKNLHYTYLQFFHRECIEKHLLSGKMPYVPESMSEAEPLEEIDAEELDDPESTDDVDISDAPDFPEFDMEEPEIGSENISREEYLMREAIRIFHEEGTATVNSLRKHLNIGFAEGARILNALEDDDIIIRNKSGVLVLKEAENNVE